MSNLTIGFIGAVAVVLAGMLAWNAQALTSSTTIRPGISYSVVEKVGCRRAGAFCPLGLHWACYEGQCKCVPCIRRCCYVGGHRRCPC